MAETALVDIIRKVKLELIPPYARIKRLARDFDTNEVVAGANTPNLRQLTMTQMEKDFAQDEQLRAKQYARLFPDAQHIHDVEDLFRQIHDCNFTVTQAHNSEGRAYDKNDQIVTFILD